MGGTYGVLCPSVNLGSLSFPWTGSVTSSHPTSGREGARDQQDAPQQGIGDEESCRAFGQSPETDMAVPTVSRDQPVGEDCRTSAGDAAWPVRSCECTLTTDPDMPTPLSSPCVVTSQPEPEGALTSGVGRRRFRDLALSIAGQFYDMKNAAVTSDNQEPVRMGSASPERTESRSDDVPDPVLTSTKTLSTASAASDCTDFKASGGRRLLLEELLKARAKEQKVNI